MKQVTSDRAPEKAMSIIAHNKLLTKIPVAELEAEIEKFVEPVTKRLPEKWLKKVVSLAVRHLSIYAALDPQPAYPVLAFLQCLYVGRPFQAGRLAAN